MVVTAQIRIMAVSSTGAALTGLVIVPCSVSCLLSKYYDHGPGLMPFFIYCIFCVYVMYDEVCGWLLMLEVSKCHCLLHWQHIC